MKFGVTLSAFTAAIATLYGVLFSITYPRTDITNGIVALCALLALVTCLAAVSLWKLVFGRKS
jgi:hypothetical protein